MCYNFVQLNTAPSTRKRRNSLAGRAHYTSSKKKASLLAARNARGGKENGCSATDSLQEQSTVDATPSQPPCSTELHDLPGLQSPINGCRIMNISELSTSVYEMTAHSRLCGGICVLEGEKKSGLAVVISAVCSKCHKKFYINSSKKVSTCDGKERWVVNLAAVLSQMTTGGGLTRLNSTCAFLDVPGMQKRNYAATEEFLGDMMHQYLVEAMKTVAEEEKQHALATKDLHHGVPAITVIVDGGWSKRSHKHSYNAKSGVAVIFGAHTKKLLFIGVRNKFCSVCAIAQNKGKDPHNHRCYRNWSGSSVAMETDIITEGFCSSEKSQGLRYMRVIGDGDSSVMANIRQSVPYGMYVEKLECANHACKCYRNRLEELAKAHPEFCGKGGLTVLWTPTPNGVKGRIALMRTDAVRRCRQWKR